LILEVDSAAVVGKQLEGAMVLDSHARVLQGVEASPVDRLQFPLAKNLEWFE
jgi:hypothetical protein